MSCPVNPLDCIPSPGGVAKDAAKGAVDVIFAALVHAVVHAADQAGQAFLDLLKGTTAIDLTSGWWTSGRAAQGQDLMRAAAIGLMLLCLLCAIIHGLWRGEAGLAMRAATVDAASSVFLMVFLASAVTGLAALVDAATGALLALVPGDLAKFLNGGGGPVAGLMGMGLAAAAFVAAFILWLELLLRLVAIYTAVLLAPLALAARVWAKAQWVWHRFVQVAVVLIFSKLVIAAIIWVGAAMLAGGGAAGLGGQVANVALGTVTLAIACFAPFLLFRLLPLEAALFGFEGRQHAASKAQQGIGTAQTAVGVLAGRPSAGGGGGPSGGYAGNGPIPAPRGGSLPGGGGQVSGTSSGGAPSGGPFAKPSELVPVNLPPGPSSSGSSEPGRKLSDPDGGRKGSKNG